MFKTLRSWVPESDKDDAPDPHPDSDNREWLARHRFDVKDAELVECFPYDPYPNQMRFMRELYSCASRGRLGLFESPTGTGKTLTVICALLTWLKHAYDTSREPEVPAAALDNDPDEPDWLRESTPEEDNAENNGEYPPERKTPKVQIIYASRTHSQLSQFLGEFAKVQAAKNFKIVAVASRKILCVNQKVKALGSSWRINDECLQLQSKDTTKKQVLSGGTAKASGGCGFRCKGEPSMDNFVSNVLDKPMDIEDLVTMGTRRAVCPYYAARSAVPYADFVVVPYNCLIHKATREALGLRLQGSIVVVDEAHNLLPAIHGSHSVALPFGGLYGTSKLLATYLDHFQTRLGAAKASTVTAMKNVSDRLADAVASLLDSPEATVGLGGNSHRVMLPNAFLLGCRLSNVNIPKLLAEMNEGNLVFKIAGFADTVVKAVGQGGGPLLTIVEKQQESDNTGAQGVKGHDAPTEGKGRAAAAATFQTFLQFLQELSSADSAGRVLLAKTGGSLQLKYVLLDASTKHAETLQQAHSVILTSGTLAPLDVLTQQLYRPSDAPRMHEFTCGHIVAPERVLAVGVGCGPGGRKLKLTHGMRDSPATMDECGQLISNFCRIVPQGFVVFVPSFAYADALKTRWSQSGLAKQLAAKKRVFWESRDAAACDGMLKQYQSHIQGSPDAGALLICVVGAKLSEGINFGDGLGRCVMVLGLPYPDLRDPELNERLMHADRLAEGGRGQVSVSSSTESKLGKGGREMYTNLCMQAVNQCVGRAIRHARDYAAVVLVDVRYTAGDSGGQTLRTKLPHWVTRRWTDCPDTFAPALQGLAQFFRGMAEA
eukprot:jgi/Ulvmu1/9292/UM050_0041.1